MEDLNFTQVENGKWNDSSKRSEIYNLGRDGWGFECEVIGIWKVEGDGYKTPYEAVVACQNAVPTVGELRDMVTETFDDMEDWKRIALARELFVEKDFPFKWADVFDLYDVLSWSDMEELTKIILYGHVTNAVDPVRYDKDGHLESVSYEDLYREVNENEEEIIDAILDALEDGHQFDCTDDFTVLMESIEDGSWRERE